jgi:hypothetical protein
MRVSTLHMKPFCIRRLNIYSDSRYSCQHFPPSCVHPLSQEASYHQLGVPLPSTRSIRIINQDWLTRSYVSWGEVEPPSGSASGRPMPRGTRGGGPEALPGGIKRAERVNRGYGPG